MRTQFVDFMCSMGLCDARALSHTHTLYRIRCESICRNFLIRKRKWRKTLFSNVNVHRVCAAIANYSLRTLCSDRQHNSCHKLLLWAAEEKKERKQRIWENKSCDNLKALYSVNQLAPTVQTTTFEHWNITVCGTLVHGWWKNEEGNWNITLRKTKKKREKTHTHTGINRVMNHGIALWTWTSSLWPHNFPLLTFRFIALEK